MRWLRYVLSACVVLALATSARPQNSPRPSAPEAADEIAAAADGGESASFEAVAEQYAKRRWPIVDELCARGRAELAQRFVGAIEIAAPEEEASLTAFIEATPDRAKSVEARAAVHAAEAARDRKDFNAVLTGLDGVEPPQGTLLAVRAGYAEGMAQFMTRRYEDCASTMLVVAETAEELGWCRLAGIALIRAGAAAQNLADVRNALARYERAAKCFEQARDERGVAVVLSNLGNVYQTVGEYDRALDCMRRSLEAKEKLGDEQGKAITLGNMAIVYSHLGRHADALDLYRRSLEIEEKLGNVANQARCHINIGSIALRTGEYAVAATSLDRGLRLARESGNRQFEVGALQNLATLYHFSNDPDRARELYRKARDLAVVVRDVVAATKCEVGLASVHMACEEYDEALELLEDALPRLRSMRDVAAVADCLHDIGAVHVNRQDGEAALPPLEESLELQRRLGREGRLPQLLANLASARDLAGDADGALATALEAVKAGERVGSRAAHARALLVLARLRFDAEQYEETIAAADRGIELLSTIVGGLSDELGARARAQFSDLFAIGVGAAMHAHDAEAVAHFVECGRAGALLEVLQARDELRAAALSPELLDADTEARRAEADALAALRRATAARKLREIATAKEALDAARERRAQLIARMQREAKAAANVLYAQPATLDEMRATLAPGDALVVYSAFRARTMAMVVSREETRLVDIGANAEVEAVCERFDVQAGASDVDAAISAIREAVVAPLGLSDAVKRVLVSPDGMLSYLPFSLLLPDRVVAHVPSGTTYALLAHEESKPGKGVLALGDPDYDTPRDTEAVARLRSGWDLVPLPATRAEAQAVGTTVLLGKNANETELLRALSDPEHPRWSAVHLACHGIVDSARPVHSALAISPDAEHDGFLSVLDIFTTRVPADLVVLSACDTGRGAVVRSEGIVGLTRAFMFAGAPRVVVSLWKVDDEATGALMRKFYELRSSGEPTAAALSEAQRHIRGQAKWSHPRYWAAWALWGLPD